jgi:SDR family mycofactocin-dependent oxidoreductase
MRTADLTGQVAVITGGARGQGRAHAVGLAEDGADVVVCDVPEGLSTVPYPLGTAEELKETVALVEAKGRRCLAVRGDVGRTEIATEMVDVALSEFGRVDILVANAGIASFGLVEELSDRQWDEMLHANVTSVFKSMRAVLPHMKARGYGRIVATASMAARGGTANAAHYVAAKWGVIGLVKSLAREVAAQGITVNAVCPANVDTLMIHNLPTYRLFRPDLEHPTREDVEDDFRRSHQIPVPWVAPEEVARLVRFLVSDAARFISGSTLDVACGNTALMP